MPKVEKVDLSRQIVGSNKLGFTMVKGNVKPTIKYIERSPFLEISTHKVKRRFKRKEGTQTQRPTEGSLEREPDGDQTQDEIVAEHMELFT